MSYISIYNYSITGDCSNTSSGELFFEVTGDSPNWVVSEISGSGLLPTTILTPGSNSYYVNGLPPGNYVFQVIESTIPPTLPVSEFRSFWISSGTSVSVTSQDTTCNLNNGSVTAYTSYNFGDSTFELYNDTATLISSGSTSFGETFFVFNNLQPGTYYIIGDDGGGCQGISESFIIKTSLNFDFGYYKVDNASCVLNQGSGKIFITGLTSPFKNSKSTNADIKKDADGQLQAFKAVKSGKITVRYNGANLVIPVTIGGFLYNFSNVCDAAIDLPKGF